MRFSFVTPLLAVLCLFPLPGANATSATGAAPSIAEGATPLEQALATIDAGEISTDLHFLASDEMRGRDTPSKEQRIAARYIAARLGRLGFTPGAQEGWFWKYTLSTKSVDLETSHVALTADGKDEVRLQLGKDYAFYPKRIQFFEVQAEGVVFGGTMGEEDRQGLDLKGRWVVCRSSDVSYRDINRAVRKAKGRGVLVLPGGELDAGAMGERVRDWGQDLSEGRLGRGRSNPRARPYIYLSAEGEQKLWRMLGTTDPKVGDTFDVTVKEARMEREISTTGLENVVGLWPGNDPNLKSQLIIVSAHYDHVGTNDKGEVFNGADDNGSGTSAVLALAEALTAYGPMRRTVMLMWVSGEEKGLLGSAAWTKDPYLPNGLRPVLNLNLDMVGRNAADSLLITPTKDHASYNGLTRLAEKFCQVEGFAELGSADAYWSRSDHANFAKNLKIPVAFLFADVHKDYHKVTDTADLINYDKVRRVTRLVMRMLDGLQGDRLELE